MQQLAVAQASAEAPINENFQSLEWASVFGRRHPATTGMVWGYYGGIWAGLTIVDGTVTLSNSVNYLVVLRSTGVVSVSTTTTNWLDTANYARVYEITTAGSVVTGVVDHRAGIFGVFGMALPVRRIQEVSAALTFALADMQVCKLHPSADTTARTWTIPANASVAFPIGAELEGVNQNAAGVITLAITTDTMRLAGAGTTGSRSVAANGWFLAKKLTATEWIVRGDGVT